MILGNVQSQGNRFLEMSMIRGTKIFSCPLLWVHYRKGCFLQNRCINRAKKVDLGIGKDYFLQNRCIIRQNDRFGHRKKLFLTKSMHYKRKRGLNSNKNCRDRKNAIFLRPRWYPNFFKGVLTQTINFFKGVLI